MATCVSWRTQQALTDTYQHDAFDMPIASTGTTWPIPKPRSFERCFPRFKLFVTTFAFMLTWAFCYGDGPQSPGARFHIVWLTALTLHLIAFRYRSIRFLRSLCLGSPNSISNGWNRPHDFPYSCSERPLG